MGSLSHFLENTKDSLIFYRGCFGLSVFLALFGRINLLSSNFEVRIQQKNGVAGIEFSRRRPTSNNNGESTNLHETDYFTYQRVLKLQKKQNRIEINLGKCWRKMQQRPLKETLAKNSQRGFTIQSIYIHVVDEIYTKSFRFFPIYLNVAF